MQTGTDRYRHDNTVTALVKAVYVGGGGSKILEHESQLSIHLNLNSMFYFHQGTRAMHKSLPSSPDI